MTTVTITCPTDKDCPKPTQRQDIHHTKINELNGDEDAILDWLFHGYTDCPYCSVRLRLTFD